MVHFNGDLLRSQNKLNMCRFRRESYSPVSLLIVDHMTEAVWVTPFSGQPQSDASKEMRKIHYK